MFKRFFTDTKTSLKEVSKIIYPTAENVITSLNCKIYEINECSIWHQHLGKTIDFEMVVIKNMGDIHPFSDGPVFNCKTVVVERCDKNFVYYWLNHKTFPNVTNIFLLSHPCEPNLFLRWYYIQKYSQNATIPNIYLSHWYSRYKDRWASEMENVQTLNETDINLLQNKIKELV